MISESCQWLLFTDCNCTNGYHYCVYVPQLNKMVGECGFESRRGHGCLSVVSVVC